MRVEYDKDLDIMYIRLKEGKYAFSEEINENALIERLGVAVFDVRPERLVESIVQELSVSVSIPASRVPSR